VLSDADALVGLFILAPVRRNRRRQAANRWAFIGES
jgi:hypothetical protein